MIKEEQIIRSRRRSIALEIRPGGELVVRAPYHASRTEIDSFVAEKQQWIAEKQAKNKHSAGRAALITAMEGSRIPFLGANLLLRYHDRSDMRLESPTGEKANSFWQEAAGFPYGLPDYDGAALMLPAPGLRAKGIRLAPPDPETILMQNRNMLLYWYKTQARHLLTERTSFFAQEMGLSVSRIRISSARTNWGSCNAQHGINYSCFLCCLSPREIDYVVVHELSHIRHRDHSKAFYAEIEKTLPDYREREAGIKTDQWVLEILR